MAKGFLPGIFSKEMTCDLQHDPEEAGKAESGGLGLAVKPCGFGWEEQQQKGPELPGTKLTFCPIFLGPVFVCKEKQKGESDER